MYGSANIAGGIGDYLNIFGGQRNWNRMEHVYSGISQDYAKNINVAVDAALSRVGALRSVPVTIYPHSTHTITGYGSRSTASVESKVPLINDVIQGYHGIDEITSGS